MQQQKNLTLAQLRQKAGEELRLSQNLDLKNKDHVENWVFFHLLEDLRSMGIIPEDYLDTWINKQNIRHQKFLKQSAPDQMQRHRQALERLNERFQGFMKKIKQQGTTQTQVKQTILIPYERLITKDSLLDPDTEMALNQMSNLEQPAEKESKFIEIWKKSEKKIEEMCEVVEGNGKKKFCDLSRKCLLDLEILFFCMELIRSDTKNKIKNRKWITQMKELIDSMLEKIPESRFDPKKTTLYFTRIRENVLKIMENYFLHKTFTDEDINMFSDLSSRFERILRKIILPKSVSDNISLKTRKFDYLKKHYVDSVQKIKKIFDPLPVRKDTQIKQKVKTLLDLIERSKYDVADRAKELKEDDDFSIFFKEILNYFETYKEYALLLGYLDTDFRLSDDLDSAITQMQVRNNMLQQQKKLKREQEEQAERNARQLLALQAQSVIKQTKKSKKSVRTKRSEASGGGGQRTSSTILQTAPQQTFQLPPIPQSDIVFHPTVPRLPIPRFRHLPVKKKQGQEQTQYQQRNRLIQKIKSENQEIIYTQLESREIVPKIWKQARGYSVIYLVDIANLFRGVYHKISSLEDIAGELNTEYPGVLDKRSGKYFVLINQGDYNKSKKKKWERVKIERFNEGENFTILEVGCKYENLDCFVGMRPNPMDDLTLRVLHRGLSDIRNDLIQKKQETLNRLQSWKTRAQQMLKRRPIRFSQQLSGQREKVEDVNKKIRALQRLEFPEIIVLSRDQYADFESAN